MSARIEPVHRRDGMRAVRIPFVAWPRYARSWAKDLRDTQKMFETLAGQLDFRADLLRRCKLDADELLEIACRAQVPDVMRAKLREIAKELRDQITLVSSVIRFQKKAPHFFPADDEFFWRPALDLAADAKALGRLATLLEGTADRPPQAARQPREGEYVITFRNVINGETERHYRDTVEAARELAANHQPFNNTDPSISRAIRIGSDRFDFQTVALTSEADERAQRTETSH